MKILLISNSGRPFLEHCLPTMVDFLKPIQQVSFISAAPFINENEYVAKVRDALKPVGIQVEHLDVDANPLKTLANAQVVLVGGGNTYRLLKRLKAAKLIEPLRKRVLEGMPFIGWSAGANIAGPTILTTNDWNVVGLNDFNALSLVPFNINPHYVESDPRMAPFSETRDQRIAEFHQVNHNPVIGIEEQTSLSIINDQMTVIGQGKVRLFSPKKDPQDFFPGQSPRL